MYFEQFYLGCLAHASYILISDGQAIVVDPQRDVQQYLEAAEKHDAVIRHIFETHLHADFVSGHKELAQRTGATIYIGPNSGATLPHVEARDGFEVTAGSVRVRVLETPGHTPESICLLVTDEKKASDPWAVLTGDTLFIGDVGRPDLSNTFSPAELAGMLYDSLHNKLLTLPDNVEVYPGHGAGSLCGRNLSTSRSSTIRNEKLTNYALQFKTREEFVQQLTANVPPRPEYFPQDAQINRQGAPALEELPKPEPMSAQDLKAWLANGGVAIDVRPGPDFAAVHIPSSISIPLGGQFASWAGIVLGLNAQPVLIADSDEEVAEARMRLARVGLDEVRGCLEGGLRAWQDAGFETGRVEQITVRNLVRQTEGESLQVLDVRRASEWDEGHVQNALFYSLDRFKASLPDTDRQKPVAVICKSGYRSLIACSLLRRAGVDKVVNVIGGFDAWKKADLPIETNAPLAA